jgi:hypothetical protein
MLGWSESWPPMPVRKRMNVLWQIDQSATAAKASARVSGCQSLSSLRLWRKLGIRDDVSAWHEWYGIEALTTWERQKSQRVSCFALLFDVPLPPDPFPQCFLSASDWPSGFDRQWWRGPTSPTRPDIAPATGKHPSFMLAFPSKVSGSSIIISIIIVVVT